MENNNSKKNEKKSRKKIEKPAGPVEVYRGYVLLYVFI
jgi:hypothetical protein